MRHVFVLLCALACANVARSGVPIAPNMEMVGNCLQTLPPHPPVARDAGYFYMWHSADYKTFKIGYSNHADFISSRYEGDINLLKKQCASSTGAMWEALENRVQAAFDEDPSWGHGVGEFHQLDMHTVSATGHYRTCIHNNFQPDALSLCRVNPGAITGNHPDKNANTCLDNIFSAIMQHRGIKRSIYAHLTRNIGGQWYTGFLPFGDEAMIPWLKSGHTEFFDIPESVFDDFLAWRHENDAHDQTIKHFLTWLFNSYRESVDPDAPTLFCTTDEIDDSRLYTPLGGQQFYRGNPFLEEEVDVDMGGMV